MSHVEDPGDIQELLLMTKIEHLLSSYGKTQTISIILFIQTAV